MEERLTGGEPLVRQNVEDLVTRLSAIPGIEDIALTTNGIFLAPKAEALKQAGITRINLSLDSMKQERVSLDQIESYLAARLVGC